MRDLWSAISGLHIRSVIKHDRMCTVSNTGSPVAQIARAFCVKILRQCKDNDGRICAVHVSLLKRFIIQQHTHSAIKHVHMFTGSLASILLRRLRRRARFRYALPQRLLRRGRTMSDQGQGTKLMTTSAGTASALPTAPARLSPRSVVSLLVHHLGPNGGDPGWGLT